MDDSTLLVRFEAGSTHAFDAIVERYEQRLLRYALGVCRDRELAADAVQEAFVALARKCLPKPATNTTSSIDDVAAWLYRVTRNRVIDTLKKEIRMRQREGVVAQKEAIDETPVALLEKREREHILLHHLNTLRPELRELLHLKLNEGRSYREIATITNFSVGKVAKLVHQGLSEVARGLRGTGVL